MLTVEELSQLFKVSTKTISRWRQQGLVSRRFVFDGRKRVGFLKSSVDTFVARNDGAGQPRRAIQSAQSAASGKKSWSVRVVWPAPAVARPT